MGFKMKKVNYYGTPVIELYGKLSGENTIKVSRVLEKMCKKKIHTTVLDLSNINYIDSNWIGVFIYSWKLYNECHKKLIFLIPPGFVLDILKETHLDKTFEIINSLGGLEDFFNLSTSSVR